MMSLELLHHPSLFVRKAVAKARRRIIPLPDRPVTRLINGTIRFEHTFEPFLDEDDFRAMLTHSYAIAMCDVLAQHLAAGDIYIDAGSNVGYIAAVAASYVGPAGEIHGFEPLQECFARLEVLRDLNPDIRFVFNNVACGDIDGVLPISFNPQGDSRNATLVPGKRSAVTREVPVVRLDTYIFNRIAAPERIKVIKMDVEGFEFPVLLGLEQFFTRTPHRPLIVVEIKPWELEHIGHTVDEFDQYMKRFSYRPYDLVQRRRVIDLRKLRDLDLIVFRA